MMLLDLLLDTTLDVAKMIPFLFAAYLAIEYIERKKSNSIERLLRKGGRFGFVPGAALGLIPQCGFSAMAANFYASGVITLGTLIAVFISTSDEAIPIMLAHPESYSRLVWLIAIKLVYALFVGFLLDVVLRKWIPNQLRGGYGGDVNAVTCHSEDEDKPLLVAAVLHTANILAYVFAFTFAFGLLVELIGEGRVAEFFKGLGLFQPFVASLFGLIPNCASSILLTQLYLENTISFGSILAGLSTNAGVGLMILFKANKNIKQSMFILVLLYSVGVALGLVVHFLGY